MAVRTSSTAVGTGLLHGLNPHIEANIVSFHGIVGNPAVVADEGVPFVDKGGICRRADALEVVPGGQMANQWARVEARKLFLANREGGQREGLRRICPDCRALYRTARWRRH